MVIALSGENSFLVRVELEKLITPFLAEHGNMAVERLDGESASFERLQEALQSVPFLASRKMVVLRAPSANKEFAEKAERLITELPDTTDLVIVEPKLDKRGAYYKLLKKATNLKECIEPDETTMPSWLAAIAKERGGSISSADARFLAERVGSNQQALTQELEKLLIYEPKITRQTIELLTGQSPQSSIFQLLETAFAGRAEQMLQLYQEQRAQKVDTAQIIAMLTWQLRILALIKAAAKRSPQEIASAAKLSPFVVRKTQAIADRLSLSQLKQLITELLEIDIRSKRERIDMDDALQVFLLSLSQLIS